MRDVDLALTCPYCAADPGRIPQRRYLCCACGNRVAVRAIRGRRLPYLLTEDAAATLDQWTGSVAAGRGSPIHELAQRLVVAADPDATALEWAERHELWDDLARLLRERGDDARAVEQRATRHRLEVLAARHAADPDVGVVLLQTGEWCEPVDGAEGWLSFGDASEIPIPARGCSADRCRCRWVLARRSEVETWGAHWP